MDALACWVQEWPGISWFILFFIAIGISLYHKPNEAHKKGHLSSKVFWGGLAIIAYMYLFADETTCFLIQQGIYD